eukprot:TRINITY_DN620_c0_g1_i11.p2 TRINITY_DN620_c0_g1~~TRINITY_DN620_c0_g1_i11.p2  ORF type:complete len:167 (+),score=21.76 TRINITY_DN620_c0_g1_i11:1348-1848(+)
MSGCSPLSTPLRSGNPCVRCLDDGAYFTWKGLFEFTKKLGVLRLHATLMPSMIKEAAPELSCPRAELSCPRAELSCPRAELSCPRADWGRGASPRSRASFPEGVLQTVRMGNEVEAFDVLNPLLLRSWATENRKVYSLAHHLDQCHAHDAGLVKDLPKSHGGSDVP